MNHCELTVGVAALANAIANALADEDLDKATIAVKLLGENLEAIALYRALKHGDPAGVVPLALADD